MVATQSMDVKTGMQEPGYGPGVEVERKFLVSQVPEIDTESGDEIDQGYLATGGDGEVRVRRREDSFALTAKRGAGLSREEAEVEIGPDQFDELWPLTKGRRIHKRRHLLPHEGVEIELDVYTGELEGLVVAEVEFDSEEQARAFDPPAWLGKDVTGDEAYLNETLAVRGVPDR